MEPKKPLFEGVGTALITPFCDGGLDMHAFEQLIRKQLDAGVDALIVAGTTGEASTLSEAEHKLLLQSAVYHVGGAVPVIAGCGSNDTEKMRRLSANARICGCDGLLLVTPYYNKATPEGLIASYRAVADENDLPILLYYVPSRTGLTVAPAVWAKLAEHPRIVGLKDASGSISYLADTMAACGKALGYYSGNDDLIHPTIAMGGQGVISVLSNLIPAAVRMLTRLSLTGENKKAAELQLFYLPLIRALFSEVNPIPVKTALSVLGLCREEFRLPLCPISDAGRARLLREMSAAGVI